MNELMSGLLMFSPKVRRRAVRVVPEK